MMRWYLRFPLLVVFISCMTQEIVRSDEQVMKSYREASQVMQDSLRQLLADNDELVTKLGRAEINPEETRQLLDVFPREKMNQFIQKFREYIHRGDLPEVLKAVDLTLQSELMNLLSDGSLILLLEAKRHFLLDEDQKGMECLQSILVLGHQLRNSGTAFAYVLGTSSIRKGLRETNQHLGESIREDKSFLSLGSIESSLECMGCIETILENEKELDLSNFEDAYGKEKGVDYRDARIAIREGWDSVIAFIRKNKEDWQFAHIDDFGLKDRIPAGTVLDSYEQSMIWNIKSLQRSQLYELVLVKGLRFLLAVRSKVQTEFKNSELSKEVWEAILNDPQVCAILDPYSSQPFRVEFSDRGLEKVFSIGEDRKVGMNYIDEFDDDIVLFQRK